jgi:predicted anti-sigma-YlaC factor YlaD
MERGDEMSTWRTMVRHLKGKMLRYLPFMMTCEDLENFILDYFEDRLTLGQKGIFETHIAMCRDCRDYLEAYRKTVEMGKTVCKDSSNRIPDSIPDDLVHAILAAVGDKGARL